MRLRMCLMWSQMKGCQRRGEWRARGKMVMIRLRRLTRRRGRGGREKEEKKSTGSECGEIENPDGVEVVMEIENQDEERLSNPLRNEP